MATVSWLPGFILEARPRPRSLVEGACRTLAVSLPSSPAEQGPPLPCQGLTGEPALVATWHPRPPWTCPSILGISTASFA